MEDEDRLDEQIREQDPEAEQHEREWRLVKEAGTLKALRVQLAGGLPGLRKYIDQLVREDDQRRKESGSD